MLERLSEIHECVSAHRRRWILPKCIIDPGNKNDSLIQVLICAGLVSSHHSQIARLLITSDHSPKAPDKFLLLSCPNMIRETGNGSENVDGRISTLICDRTVKNDVTIERASNVVGHRIIVIVAIDENGEDAGD